MSERVPEGWKESEISEFVNVGKGIRIKNKPSEKVMWGYMTELGYE